MARSGLEERNRRMRAAFTSQTAAQLREWAALLAQGADGMDESVAIELEQTAERAEALKMAMIAMQCRAAAARVRSGISDWSLRPVITSLAAFGHRRAFPSMVVVATKEELPQLMDQAAACCEPLRFLTSTDALRSSLQCELIQGVLLPQSRIDEVEQLEERLNAPIYIYGEASVADRLAAAEQGAAGWVDLPIPLDVVLRRQRRDTWRTYLGRPRVLVVADPGPCEALVAKLEASEPAMHARALSDPSKVLEQLAEVAPEMVILGSEIGGKSGAETLAVILTDAEAADLPLAVLGDEPWTHEQGERDGLRRYPDIDSVTEAVRSVIALTHTGSSSLDRVTGAHARPNILEALDRELARSRRSHSPVTAVAVAVDNLHTVRESVGSSRADQGLRAAARVLADGVRHYDLVGRVTEDTFLICMPDCPEDPAIARLEILHKRFKDMVADDPDLSILSWSVGVTDSEQGHAQVLRRVDDALERARSTGRPGTIAR